MMVPRVPRDLVVGGDDLVPEPNGHHRKEIFRKRTATVGGVDGGERGNIFPHAEVGDGIADVKPALGMGDDIHLFRSRQSQDRLDAAGKLLGGIADGGGGLMLAVIHPTPKPLQFLGHSAPIVEAGRVAKEKAVH